MADRQDKPRAAGQDAARAEREHRLARALRDNLRQRKEQARAKTKSPASSAPPGKDRDPAGRGG
jgi:hypothetical protein